MNWNIILPSVSYILLVGVLSYGLGKKYISLIKNKIKQPLLENGPDHKQKIGTPTMGGIVFYLLYFVIILGIIILMGFYSHEFLTSDIVIILVITCGHFLIGLKDDYQKVTFNKNSSGLSARQKLCFQILLGGIFVVYLIFFSPNTSIYLSNNIVINLKYFYYILVIFMMVGFSNATNLTDGVDGLLATNGIISLFFLTIISVMRGDPLIFFSNITLIGALLGFLVLNFNPAKVFMGDTGSLVLGAYVVVVGVLLKVEILLLFFGIIYIIEAISVILQVSYFKYTKKKYGQGRRIFLMVPIHHHYEKKGYSEKKIVYLFACVTFIISLIGFLLFFA